MTKIIAGALLGMMVIAAGCSLCCPKPEPCPTCPTCQTCPPPPVTQRRGG